MKTFNFKRVDAHINSDFDEAFYLLKLKTQVKVMPSEPCYVRLRSITQLSKIFNHFIIDLTQKTTEVFLSMPMHELNYQSDEFVEIINKLKNYGVKGLVLQTKVDSNRWSIHKGIGCGPFGDKDILEGFERIKRALPDKEISLELDLSPQDTRVVGATISELHQMGLKWCVFNIEEVPIKSNKSVKQIKEIFEFLKYQAVQDFNVYFPFWLKNSKQWDALTENIYAGPVRVDLDLTNRCTHSCNFCGTYSEDVLSDIKNQNNGKLPESISNFMRQEIDENDAIKIIKSLPFVTEHIQLGGFGDPLLHKGAIQVIETARNMGIKISCLSNMEYLDENKVLKLHELTQNYGDIEFLANISGGNEQSYLKTRPRQSAKVFRKIVNTLKQFSDLKNNEEGKGVEITLMCVVNRENVNDLKSIADLAEEVKADFVWYKPMEIHGEAHKKLAFTMEDAKQLAINVEEVGHYLEKKGIKHYPVKLENNQLPSKEDQSDNTQHIDVEVANGNVSKDYYSQNPCHIGLNYIRFSMNRDILPCCISKYSVGASKDKTWREVWHSSSYEAFRRKTKKINEEQFHLWDPEWSFCKQCPHIYINDETNKLLALRESDNH